jgi:hypothetical protein
LDRLKNNNLSLDIQHLNDNLKKMQQPMMEVEEELDPKELERKRKEKLERKEKKEKKKARKEKKK